MKILIVTQVVDLDHPILEFFHRWIAEFATQCESVEVICLQAGRYSLPANVTVHSLGKELGVSRLHYVWRFYKYVWQRRHHYDSVFVHMNQIYVLLGWLPWLWLRKPVSLWYMHGSTSFSLRIASRLVHRIFTGSPESFLLHRSSLLVTGHGIDTNLFRPDQAAGRSYDLITVGRITPSKNIDELIKILAHLTDDTVTLTIVGAPVTEAEEKYQTQLKELAAKRTLEHRVRWLGRVEQSKLPQTLQQAKVFVTAAQNGSLDKAMLEPLACGLPMVSMAPGSQSLPLGANQVRTQLEFVAALNQLLAQPADTSNLVSFVQENHSLERLIAKICTKLQS